MIRVLRPVRPLCYSSRIERSEAWVKTVIIAESYSRLNLKFPVRGIRFQREGKPGERSKP